MSLNPVRRNLMLKTLSSKSSSQEEKENAIKAIADQDTDRVAFKAIVQAVDEDGLQATSISAVEHILSSCETPKTLTRHFKQLIDLVLSKSFDPDTKGYLLLRKAIKVLQTTTVDTSDCVSIVMLYTPGRGFKSKTTDNRIGKLFLDFLNTAPEKLLAHNITRKSFADYNNDQQLRGLLEPDTINKGILLEIIRQFRHSAGANPPSEVIAAHVRLLFEFILVTDENVRLVKEGGENITRWIPESGKTIEDKLALIEQLNNWSDTNRENEGSIQAKHNITFSHLVVKHFVDALTDKKRNIIDKTFILNVLAQLKFTRYGQHFRRIVDWINDQLDDVNGSMKVDVANIVSFLASHSPGIDLYDNISDNDRNDLLSAGVDLAGFLGGPEIHRAYSRKSVELLLKIACDERFNSIHRVAAVSAIIRAQPHRLVTMIEQVFETTNAPAITVPVYRKLGEIKYHKAVRLLLSRLEGKDYAAEESRVIIQALLQIGTREVLGNYQIGQESVAATGLLNYIFEGNDREVREMIENGLIALGFGQNIRYERARREAMNTVDSIKVTRDATVRKDKEKEGLIDVVERNEFDIHSLRTTTTFSRLSLVEISLIAQADALDVHIRFAEEGEKLKVLSEKVNEKSQEISHTKREIEKATDHYNEVYNQIKKLREEIKSLLELMKVQKRLAEGVQKDIISNEHEIKNANDDIQRLKIEKPKISSQLTTIEESKKLVRENEKEIIQNLDRIKNNLNSADQSEFERLNRELNDSNTTYSDLDREIIDLKSSLDKNEQSIINKSETIKRANDNISRAKSKISGISANLEKLSEGVRSLSSRIDDEYHPQLEASKNEVVRFQRSLDGQIDTLNGLQLKIAAVKEVIVKLGKQEKKLVEAYRTKEAEVRSANKKRGEEIASLVTNKNEAANRMSELIRDIENNTSHLVTMGNRKQELDMLLADLGPECSEQTAIADRRHREEAHDIWLAGFQKDVINHMLFFAIQRAQGKFNQIESKSVDILSNDIYRQKTKE